MGKDLQGLQGDLRYGRVRVIREEGVGGSLVREASQMGNCDGET